MYTLFVCKFYSTENKNLFDLRHFLRNYHNYSYSHLSTVSLPAERDSLLHNIQGIYTNEKEIERVSETVRQRGKKRKREGKRVRKKKPEPLGSLFYCIFIYIQKISTDHPNRPTVRVVHKFSPTFLESTVLEIVDRIS